MAGNLKPGQIAVRLPLAGRGLEVFVEQGEQAVLLVDGAQSGVVGPGPLDEFLRQNKRRRIEAVICEARDITMEVPCRDLRISDDTRVEVLCRILVSVADPGRFVARLFGSRPAFTASDLSALLTPEVERVAANQLAKYSLATLKSDLLVSQKVQTALENHFRSGLDLPERYGLQLVGVRTLQYGVPNPQPSAAGEPYLYLKVNPEGEPGPVDVTSAAMFEHPAVRALFEQLRARLEAQQQSVRHTLLTPASPPDHAELWRAQAPGPVYGPVALTADYVLAGCWDKRAQQGGVLWLDRQSGNQVDFTPLSGGVEGGVILDGRRAIAVTRAGSVAFLDIDSRRLIRQVADVGGVLRSTPLLHEGVVCASSDSPGFVTAVVAQSGAVRSRWTVPENVGVRSTPLMLGRFLYFAARNGRLFRADPQRRGQPEAFGPAFQPYFLSSPVGDSENRRLFVAGSNHQCYALDERGAALWREPFRGNGQFSGTPLLDGDTLFIGCFDGHLYAVNSATGRERWRLRSNGAIAATPAAWQDLLFVGCNDGHLYAVKRNERDETQRLFWKFSTGAPIFAAPTIAEETGVLYFGDEAGGVYALPWHGKMYAKAALHSRETARFEQAGDLLLLGGDPEAARESYREGSRFAQAAAVSEGVLSDYQGAARDYEKSGNWAAAALAWARVPDATALERCRERLAEQSAAPLLRLAQRNAPAATLGDEIDMTFEVLNVGRSAARNVVVYVGGHIQQKDMQRSIPYLAPGDGQRLAFRLSPAASGSSTILLHAACEDSRGLSQLPAILETKVEVVRPQAVQHIYQGPVYRVERDGVIIVRQGGLTGGRTMRIQSDEDSLEING